MFNLYQNQNLTKELIIGKQLHRCKLAFWYSVIEGGQLVAISPRSYSSIIEESKFIHSNFSVEFSMTIFF